MSCAAAISTSGFSRSPMISVSQVSSARLHLLRVRAVMCSSASSVDRRLQRVVAGLEVRDLLVPPQKRAACASA